MKPRLVEVTLTIMSDAPLKNLKSAKWWDLDPGFDWSLLNSQAEPEKPLVLRASARTVAARPQGDPTCEDS